MPKIKAPVYVNGKISTDNQLESTVATGTAPLAISSITKVNNLNVEAVDGIHFRNDVNLQWSINNIDWYDVGAVKELDDLDDVVLTEPLTEKQVLVKEGENWVNGNPVHVGETAPAVPFPGQIWVDTSLNQSGFSGYTGSMGYTGSAGAAIIDIYWGEIQ